MTEKGTIILVSNTHWHHAWQTSNSVAAGFAARGYHVLFVEPIPKRWPRLTEMKRVLGRLMGNSRMAGLAAQKIPDGVELIAPITLPDVGEFAQFLNRRFFIPQLVMRLKQKISSGSLILIHTLPIHAAIALQKHLKPNISVYRCVYDWAQDPYSRRKLAEIELLQEVDIVWADCDYNLQRVQVVRPDATLMPPAVDLSLFTAVTYTRSGLPKPLCVYFGTIALSIDMELLAEISQRYFLRLIGPVRAPLDNLAAKTEIVGPVSHKQIPDLIRDADVLLLPYNARPHMQGVIPAKLFECLATGKAIVATNLTTIDRYRDLVYLCNGHEAVFKAIESSQNEDKTLVSQRIAVAQTNSWHNRLDQMEQAIRNALAVH